MQLQDTGSTRKEPKHRLGIRTTPKASNRQDNRDVLGVTPSHKHVYNHVHAPPDSRNRRPQTARYLRLYCRSEVFKLSFILAGARLWKQLPGCTVMSPALMGRMASLKYLNCLATLLYLT